MQLWSRCQRSAWPLAILGNLTISPHYFHILMLFFCCISRVVKKRKLWSLATVHMLCSIPVLFLHLVSCIATHFICLISHNCCSTSSVHISCPRRCLVLVPSSCSPIIILFSCHCPVLALFNLFSCSCLVLAHMSFLAMHCYVIA